MRAFLRFAILLACITTVTFTTHPALAGTTERISISTAGVQGNNDSGLRGVSTSSDGRYVAFDSDADNLVSGDTNGCSDVFVRDRVTGVTEIVSVSTAGVQGDSASYYPSISADGRYVAFDSHAENLVSGDTNRCEDIFVHDRVSGVTERVSVSSAGAQGNNLSEYPSISADGRYVAFDSFAGNLVSGDTNAYGDVFVRDRVSGVTERVSVSTAGAQGNQWSDAPSISNDGRYVAFQSWASNLVSGDGNGCQDVFVRDRVSGTTERVSISTAGGEARGGFPSISADGRYVAFDSDAANLVSGDTNGLQDVFVRDRVSGVTERVSVSTGGTQGTGVYGSASASISSTGRYVAFQSYSDDLVSGDIAATRDIFVRDRVSEVTERISASTGGAQWDDDSYSPSISADGKYVGFASSADDLVSGDTNGRYDVFVRAPELTTAALVTISTVDDQRMWIRYPNYAGTYWYGRQQFSLAEGQTYLVQGQTPGGWDSADLSVAADGTVSVVNWAGNLHQFEVGGKRLVVYNPTLVTVSPSDNLKSVIESAGDGTKIVLGPGDFYLNETILLQDMRDVTITGAGVHSTIIHVGSNVGIAFQLGSNLENIRFERFCLKGTLPLQVNTHGIASTGGANNVRGITYNELWVEDVAVGLSVGSGVNNTYDGATITNNTILRASGTESGSGYGIHSDNAKNLLIANNYIEGATRHSIYVARGNTNIVVDNNFILNHDYDETQTHRYAAANAIARTGSARVANNIVMNTYTPGISVEYDEVLHNPISNVTLVNNRVIGAKFYGIWVNAGIAVTAIGNTVVRHPGTYYDTILVEPNPDTGSPSSLVAPNSRWASPDFMVELAGCDYVMKGGVLDRIVPYAWTYNTSPTNWFSTQGVTGLENARGEGVHRVYVVQNAVLHEVNPETWVYVPYSPPDWYGTQFMAATAGYVHIMKNNTLYRVTPGTFASITSPITWSNTLGMVDWGGYLYILQNGVYHRVDPVTLEYEALGSLDVKRQISGSIVLKDFKGSVSAVPITVQIHRRDEDTTLTRTIYLTSTGGYTVPDLYAGTYDISFKASHWLRKTVTVTIGVKDITGVNVSLVNSDINGDNIVNAADLFKLRTAYGSVLGPPASPSWNPNADLNGDGVVNAADLFILRKDYGAVGS